ncbi:hypothetical protein [Saccharothrix sp. Mg75]|uniref:hypothetical protein n=1 Tax=Saccharothrix sp. Mg75 TaxID=3445357 RepID=UPI003EEAB07A
MGYVRAALGVVVVLALTVVGAALWGGPVARMWNLTTAQPCPEQAPASDCLVTVRGWVVSRFDDRGDAHGTITLKITGAAANTGYAQDGQVDAFLGVSNVERLGVVGVGDELSVTLFDSGVVALTGEDGAVVEARVVFGTASEAWFRLLAVGGAAIVAVAGGGVLWRRVRGGRAGWIRRAVVCAVLGVVAGATVGAATAAPGAVWVVPTMFSVAVVLGLAAALVRLPRAWRSGTTPTGST